MTDTAQHALTMSLPELRERVELAERLALAARLTPSGTYAGAADPVKGDPAPAPEAPKPRARRTKEQIAADEAAAAAAAAPASEPTADEMLASMETGDAADAAAAGELSLDEIGSGDGDDMMAGFEALDADKSPEEYRALCTAIITDIQTKKDVQRLGVAREALVKLGVQKAGDVPDDKIKQFYEMLPK